MPTRARTITLQLIRHAESEANAGARTRDAASMGLSPEGLCQAEALAEREVAAPDLVLCSPYRRALETAAPLRRRFPDVPVETWPIEEFTPLAAAAWHDTTAADRSEAVEAIWRASDPHLVAGPGAESFAQFLERVDGAWRRFRALPGGTVLVFTHRKFIAALIWSALSAETGVSARRMRQFRGFDQSLAIPNGARVEVRLDADDTWIGPVEPLPCRISAR